MSWGKSFNDVDASPPGIIDDCNTGSTGALESILSCPSSCNTHHRHYPVLPEWVRIGSRGLKSAFSFPLYPFSLVAWSVIFLNNYSAEIPSAASKCNGRVSHPAALVTTKRACLNNPLLNRTWKPDVWRTSLKSGLEVVSEDGVWWWRGWWWWRWVLQGQEWGLDKMITIDGWLKPDNKRLHWNRRVYFQVNRYMLIYSCSSISSIY